MHSWKDDLTELAIYIVIWNLIEVIYGLCADIDINLMRSTCAAIIFFTLKTAWKRTP